MFYYQKFSSVLSLGTWDFINDFFLLQWYWHCIVRRTKASSCAKFAKRPETGRLTGFERSSSFTMSNSALKQAGWLDLKEVVLLPCPPAPWNRPVDWSWKKQFFYHVHQTRWLFAYSLSQDICKYQNTFFDTGKPVAPKRNWTFLIANHLLTHCCCRLIHRRQSLRNSVNLSHHCGLEHEVSWNMK